MRAEVGMELCKQCIPLGKICCRFARLGSMLAACKLMRANLKSAGVVWQVCRVWGETCKQQACKVRLCRQTSSLQVLCGKFVEFGRKLASNKLARLGCLSAQACYMHSLQNSDKLRIHTCTVWVPFSDTCTVKPRYNEVLGTIKITLLYQVSHYIRVKNKEI